MSGVGRIAAFSIDSAPRHGTPIIALEWFEGEWRDIGPARFETSPVILCGHQPCWLHDERGDAMTPTHWLPFPDDPDLVIAQSSSLIGTASADGEDAGRAPPHRPGRPPATSPAKAPDIILVALGAIAFVLFFVDRIARSTAPSAGDLALLAAYPIWPHVCRRMAGLRSGP